MIIKPIYAIGDVLGTYIHYEGWREYKVIEITNQGYKLKNTSAYGETKIVPFDEVEHDYWYNSSKSKGTDENKTCSYIEIQQCNETVCWECSRCSNCMYFSADGPKENDVNYCPNCGRKITEYIEAKDEESEADNE